MKNVLPKRVSFPLLSLVFIVLLGSVSAISFARNIDHVNVGRIAVNNQSLRSQQAAGKLALAQVFVKLSGNQRVLQEPEISKAVDNYEQFLISSSFIQGSHTLIFEATFNQQKVESLLLASGLSVWASLRPSGVIWLAINNADKQKVMVSQLSAANLSEELSLKSFARGVDIVMPIGDLEDSMNLSVYDIWNQYISKIQEHSKRYATDYLLNATVQSYDQQQAVKDLAESEIFYDRNHANEVETIAPIDNINTDTPLIDDNIAADEESTFNELVSVPIKRDLLVDTLVPDGTTHKLDYVITHVNPQVSRKVETGRVFGDSEIAVIRELVDVYANMLAKEFALSAPNKGSSETIQVVFNGIDSLQDYVKLMALIRTIPAVKNVRLIRQSNTKAVLELQQSMSMIQLKSILVLDSRITAESVPVNAAISFRWLG